MRLTITIDELQKGSSVQTGTQERIRDLEHCSRRGEPIAIHPLRLHDKLIGAVLLSREGVHHGSHGRIMEIFFRPIWCKCFRLCSMKADQLLALILEVEDGKKYWIDDHSTSECRFTTNGPGTDPRVILEAETFFGDLLVNDPFNHIVRSAISFVQKRF